jgi:hypothetical protein
MKIKFWDEWVGRCDGKYSLVLLYFKIIYVLLTLISPMRKLFFILFLCFCSPARAQNTFEKVIDTLGFGIANCVQETFDGGYILAGGSSANNGDAMVIKLDSLGTIEWVKQFTGPGVENANYIEQTPDSGYIVNTLYDGGLNSKSSLLRLDANGDTLWTRVYSVGVGATEVELANTMATLNSTIYGLTGTYKSIPITNIKAYMISALSNGTLLKSTVYNTSIYGTEAHAIDKTIDGGFIIAGAYGPTSSTAYVYLIRTNAYGDTLWTKTYHQSQSNAGYDVKQTADSGFIIAGFTQNNVTFETNIYLVKTDLLGDTLWTKWYGDATSCNLQSVFQTIDLGYIATGRIVNGNPLAAYLYLLKTDLLGDTIWSRQFGVGPESYGRFVRQTKDGGFIISGVTFSTGTSAAFLIKVDSTGNVLTGLNSAELNNPFNFIIYPNPSAEYVTVFIKGIQKYNAELKIFNCMNQCVYDGKINNNESSTINLINIPSGLYVACLRTKDGFVNRKFVIEK